MKTSIAGLTIAAASILAATGCSKEEAPPPPAPKAEAPAPTPVGPLIVKLGHAAPLTGPQAHLGKDNENGARLAIDDANAEGVKIGGRPVQFELLSEDDQADPKQGTLVAQKFVDAKVNAVIGHLNSGTTIPASKIYFDAGIPQVSPSATNPTYTNQGFKTAFRVMANDVQQGKVLGQYAADNLKAKSVAVIDDKTAYGEGVADQFKQAAIGAGVKVVAEEHTDDKAVDFAAILTKVKGKRPDLVFYGGMDAQAGPMAAQMKKLGIKSKFLMADGGCTTEFHKLAGAADAGAYCSLPGVPLDKMPGGPAFKEKYNNKFHTDIQLYAPYVYDAVMVVVDAIKHAGSADPEKIVEALPKTDYQGVTSKIAFDEKGDIKNGAITLYISKDGKWEPLDTIGGAAPAPAPAAADAGKPAEAAAMPAPAAEKK
jgi:branched-chain amino acid transport system substrate-binding protein